MLGISDCWVFENCACKSHQESRFYTPNANMVDHSVGTRDESHEIEATQALMFCFDNAFLEKPCFAVDLAG